MEKRKIYGTIIGLFAFVLIILGLTYAYFYWSSGNSKTNVNLTVTRSIEGLIVYNQGTSILGTDNYSLQPSDDYTGGISATIEFWKVATATQNIYGQISLEVLQMLSRINTTDANVGKTDAIKWAVTTYTATNSTETLLKEGTFNGRKQGDKFALVSNISLNNYQTFYKIYIWMDQNAQNSGSVSGELLSTEISASATDVMYQFDSPALTTLTNLGITPESTYLTTFSSSSPADGTTGVYVTEDDLGPSYYFRGNVTNNYVKFGKNSSGKDMYWRIIRINGDGSIRMIYDGTQVYQNGVSSSDRGIGDSEFLIDNDSENAGVGYMNGTLNGTIFPNGTSTSTSYEEAHANKYNSTIKTYIDSWYRTNIVYTGYEDKVVDAIYCNDRKIITNQGIIDEFISAYGYYEGSGGVMLPLFSNLGFGGHLTAYGFYDRYDPNYFSFGQDVNVITPSLKCPQENDKFSKTTLLGNGNLTYSIGMITADEIVFAGGNSGSDVNTSYYLFIGDWYWTMTPSQVLDGTVGMFGVGDEGELYILYNMESSNVRPVISIAADAITGGLGTATQPFTT